MAPNQYNLIPHNTYNSSSIRKIYIQNTTDCLHVCLLRGELQRAKRAWAILIRCREVNWRSRWYWGLHLLSATSSEQEGTQDVDGRQVERWLGQLRISGHESKKPALLHATVLHLIKHDRHQDALDQLETYLPSYPFLLSGSLHTYAGMLSFYLAQPLSARHKPSSTAVNRQEREMSTASTKSATSSVDKTDEPYHTDSSTFSRPEATANPALIRQAKAWFIKATSIDPTDEVASEFLRLIDDPRSEDDASDADGDEMMDNDKSDYDIFSGEGKSDEMMDNDKSDYDIFSGEGKSDEMMENSEKGEEDSEESDESYD